MTHSTKTISPLRQRMIEDMALRKLSPKTQSNYVRAVMNVDLTDGEVGLVLCGGNEPLDAKSIANKRVRGDFPFRVHYGKNRMPLSCLADVLDCRYTCVLLVASCSRMTKPARVAGISGACCVDSTTVSTATGWSSR